MKNILILGSRSELGKKAIKFLKHQNYKLYLDNLIKKQNKKNYKNFILDSSSKIDIILNLVGYSGKSREKLRESNYNFTKMLVQTINSIKKKKILLIHFSTIGVLDLENTKKDRYKANNYYEFTKILSEKLILKRKNKFNYLILRAAALHELQKSNLTKNVSSVIFFKKYIFVSNDKSKIYFTNVKDLLEFIIKLLNRKKANKIFNISESLDIKSYLNKIKKYNIIIINFYPFITYLFRKFSNINTFLKFKLDNKFLKYFWLFNSVKIFKKINE